MINMTAPFTDRDVLKQSLHGDEPSLHLHQRLDQILRVSPQLETNNIIIIIIIF